MGAETDTFIFTWKIENFSLCKLQNGEGLRSPTFTIDLFWNVKWYLMLFPRGEQVANNQFVSIYLERESDDGGPDTLTVRFELAVVGVDGELRPITRRLSPHVFEKGEGWGYGEFMNRTSLVVAQKDYLLPNDVLTIQCLFATEDTNEPHAIRACDASEMANLSRDMAALCENGKFSDLALSTEGEVFRIHKAILHARWPLLVKEVENKSPEIATKELFTDVNPFTLRTLIQYLYSGKIEANVSCLPNDLYSIAERHHLEDLKRKIYAFPNKCTARTSILAKRKSFTWLVDNFSTRKRQERLYSPVLFTESLAGLDVKLVFNLTKETTDEDDVEILIHRLSSETKSIFVTCKISILDHESKQADSRSADHLFEGDESEWCFPAFMSKKKLIENKDLYLPNDTLSLLCDISITSGEVISRIEETRYSPSTVGKFLTASKDLSTLCNDLGDLYISRKFSDVTVRAENKDLPAHKAILSARSETFSRILEREVEDDIIIVSDTNPETLDRMLMYIYTGKIEKLEFDSASKLYETADKFQVHGLQKKCAVYLESHLEVDNACDVLLLAGNHNDDDLKAASRDFICARADEVLNNNKWDILIEKRVDLATEVLRRLSIQILRVIELTKDGDEEKCSLLWNTLRK